jgi:hypothetical protein
MILVPFLIWVLFGIGAVMVASKKGRSGCAWFALGFLLGPFGLLFAFLASPLETKSAEDSGPKEFFGPQFTPTGEISLEQETKKCPHCAEIIKLEAKKCRFCGEAFDPDQVEAEIASRRKKLEEDLAKLSTGKRRCPSCGKWDVVNAMLPNGGFGPWCPHCKKPV